MKLSCLYPSWVHGGRGLGGWWAGLGLGYRELGWSLWPATFAVCDFRLATFPIWASGSPMVNGGFPLVMVTWDVLGSPQGWENEAQRGEHGEAGKLLWNFGNPVSEGGAAYQLLLKAPRCRPTIPSSNSYYPSRHGSDLAASSRKPSLMATRAAQYLPSWAAVSSAHACE